MSKPFLTAEWKNLLIANYQIDPAVLTPYLPKHTELDTFNGTHYVSLVGFLFANTKVAGISFPFHRNFEEVNLRFYVRYKDTGGWKRGVVFIKEIVPKRMISIIANTLYGEAYRTHQMRHFFSEMNDEINVSYEWKVGKEWNYVKVVANKIPEPLAAGSEEEFITEHYWGYTFISDRCSGTYEVAHPSWNIHEVKEYSINCNAETLYGSAFAESLNQKPKSVFLAAGSSVSVMKGAKIFTSAASTQKLKLQ